MRNMSVSLPLKLVLHEKLRLYLLVLPETMQPSAHKVIHHIVARSHVAEHLANKRLLLLPRDLLEACKTDSAIPSVNTALDLLQQEASTYQSPQ
jgi:hypothetical protein